MHRLLRVLLKAGHEVIAAAPEGVVLVGAAWPALVHQLAALQVESTNLL